MSRILSIISLTAGIVLLVYGIDAADSVYFSVTHAVSNAPTGNSIWLITAGIAGIAIGGLGLVLRQQP